MKKILALFILLFALASCNNTDTKKVTTEALKKTETKIINVTTSIVPLASITNYIGGDFVKAKSLVPAGVSPHSFDIKPEQMVDIQKSDLIVYLGLEHIDGFLDKAIEGKDNVVAVKNGILFLKSKGHHDHEDEHEENGHKEEGEHHEKEGHEVDPHIWNNSENAYIIAKTIVDRLSKISPEHKNDFENNLKSFKKELDTAKNNFKEDIKNKKQGHFIVFHDAYNYLFKELNIDNTKKHIFRKNVLSDPSSNDMKTLIDEIKKENIKVAFREPQLDSSNLKKAASEYNFKILVLDPLGEDESKNGFVENYKNNLKSLENIYE